MPLEVIGLKQLERCLKQNRHATLTLVAGQKTPTETELINAITGAGYKVASSSITMGHNAALVEMSCEINWRARHDEPEQPLAQLKKIATRFSLAKID